MFHCELIYLSFCTHPFSTVFSPPEDFKKLFDDRNRIPIINTCRLDRKPRVKYIGDSDSLCEVFIMHCLCMLLRLVITNPKAVFTGMGTAIQAGHKKPLDTLFQGNDITKPNNCFIKT